MSDSKHIPAAAASWKLEFARLIAFPVQSALALDQQWWQDLVSQHPPDDEVVWPKQHFERDDYRDDRGSFQGNQLALTVDSKRIAWEVRSNRIGADESGRFPTLAPWRDKLDWLVDLLKPWLRGSCPPINRLAFHAKLLQLAANGNEAYQTLKGFLPGVELLNTDSKDLNDFLLQVNRRTKSTTGVEINQVSTWYKMNLGIEIRPGFTWRDECYCALELNINTAPEHLEAIPKDSLSDLFEELVRLGAPIAEKGIVAMKGMLHV